MVVSWVIGLPPVIIHFNGMFHEINQPFWGTLMTMETPIVGLSHDFSCESANLMLLPFSPDGCSTGLPRGSFPGELWVWAWHSLYVARKQLKYCWSTLRLPSGAEKHGCHRRLWDVAMGNHHQPWITFDWQLCSQIAEGLKVNGKVIPSRLKS